MKCCGDCNCKYCSKQDVDATNTSGSKSEIKAGYLYTISSQSFLSREKWKRRYFALDGTNLYRFHKKEDVRIDPKCRFISLDCYDVQVPSEQKEPVREPKNWKRDHVFMLVTSEIIACSNKTQHVFSADSKDDLVDWVVKLRMAVSRTRENRRPQRPPRSKIISLPALSSSLRNGDEIRNESTSAISSLVGGHLYNPNKYRVRGPKGRRLPQKKLYRQSMDVVDHFRSNSLCDLDMDDEDMEDMDLNDPDFTSPTCSQQQPKQLEEMRTRSISDLAYQYSSSEDSSSFWKSKENTEDNVSLSDKQSKDIDKVMVNQNNNDQDTALEISNDESQRTSTPVDKSKHTEAGHRYQSQSPADSMDFFDELSRRLKVMSGSLSRFRDEVDVELRFIRDCLNTTSAQSVVDNGESRNRSADDSSDDGLDSADKDSPSRTHQAIVVLKELNDAEGDLRQLANITDKVDASLRLVLSHCNEELLKTSEL